MPSPGAALKMTKIHLQVTFSNNGTNSLPKNTLENLKNKRLDNGCLAESHF